MDVERTIEFILETQAKAETRMDGVTKLLQQGMQMLVSFQNESRYGINALIDAHMRLEESQKATNAKLGELAESQKATDATVKELAGAQKATENSLKMLIDTMRQGRNGH